MTCLFASIGGIAAWRRRHSPGLRTAVWLSVGLGALSISPTLLHLSTRLLDTGPPVNDPPDSVAQLAAMIESLPRLSDQSSRFGFPEGVTWMTTGPAWLGYLVPVVIGTVTNPIVAQNIGIALGTAALFMSAWLLARSAGLAPGLSIFAGTVTVLGPAVWDELDAMSLDRSTLFLVPLFFACLNMALRKPVGPSRSHRPRPQKGRRRTQRNPFTRLRGWRWSVAAGISLGAVVYGQVYFGIYLAVAMLLIGTARVLLPAQKPAQQVQPNAPPMLGTHRYRFRQLVIIAGVGILVMSPCLAVLHHSMDDTVYGGADSATTEADESAAQAILKPITEKELAEAKGDADASGFRDFQLDSTRARLLSAVTQSIPLRRAAIPTHIMPYGGAYFVLLTVGLLMARRRTAMWVATIDLLLLMILSLGPVLRWNETGIGPVAPYGIFFATIPGFDQLKNVHRFALLAASIAGLPLALGLDGIIGRFNRTLVRRTFWTIATAGLVISVGLPRPKPGEPGVTGTEAPPAWQWPTPQFRPVSASTALQSVDPGPAFVLPLAHPTSPDVMLPLLRDGFSLVNEPPFEHTRRTIAPWWETNPTLNRLSWTAGSQRPTGLLAWTAGDAAQRDLQQLARNGVKWIILLEEWLEGPELVAPTKRFLDALVPRVAEDERVTIWSVTPNTGQP